MKQIGRDIGRSWSLWFGLNGMKGAGLDRFQDSVSGSWKLLGFSSWGLLTPAQKVYVLFLLVICVGWCVPCSLQSRCLLNLMAPCVYSQGKKQRLIPELAVQGLGRDFFFVQVLALCHRKLTFLIWGEVVLPWFVVTGIQKESQLLFLGLPWARNNLWSGGHL